MTATIILFFSGLVLIGMGTTNLLDGEHNT
jgi:hypothetical protein